MPPGRVQHCSTLSCNPRRSLRPAPRKPLDGHVLSDCPHGDQRHQAGLCLRWQAANHEVWRAGKAKRAEAAGTRRARGRHRRWYSSLCFCAEAHGAAAHLMRRCRRLLLPTGNQEDMEKFTRRLVRVTPKHNEECRQLLTLMGIPWVKVRRNLLHPSCWAVVLAASSALTFYLLRAGAV